MRAYEKPSVAMSEIEEVIRNHLGPGAVEITPLVGGSLGSVFAFVDLAILDRHMPRSGVIQAYQDHLAKADIKIPDFKERLLGAYYYKGLDGLRFYAKMDWKDACQGTIIGIVILRTSVAMKKRNPARFL